MDKQHNRQPDVEAVVYTLVSNKQPGGGTPFRDGCVLNHVVMDGCLAAGVQRYYDAESISLGASALGTITFLEPEACPACLWEGKPVRIQEGGSLIGFAEIKRIFNEALKAEPGSPVMEATQRKRESIPRATDKRVIQFNLFAAGVTDDETLDRAVFEISDKIEEIVAAYANLGLQSTGAFIERIFDDTNLGKCAACGNWCSDRTKPNAISVVSNGAQVDGRWLCDLCLPKDHPNAF